MHLLPFELTHQGQAVFWSRQLEKADKSGEMTVREAHGGVPDSEGPRFLEFRMCHGPKMG